MEQNASLLVAIRKLVAIPDGKLDADCSKALQKEDDPQMPGAVIRGLTVICSLLLSTPGVALEKLGVIAVADPAAGPDAELAELAHQLRAACRDRTGGVEDVPTMRARLLGHTTSATLAELDRAYGGALAMYQNGEFESALGALRGIAADLEGLPETPDAYAQWTRAQLRLAHAALTIAREAEADEALLAVARTDIAVAADPEQYSPTYRRRLDAVRAKVRAMSSRRLTVTAEGSEGAVFVNGRPMGTTPLALSLPPGTYRIGGVSDGLRVPSVRIDLGAEDRSVVLDFALAGALRVNAGPGLALSPAGRADGVVRAGAWLGVDRVIAVSRAVEGRSSLLIASVYDVRKKALEREGSVRMAAGGAPAASLGALAAFLLTGQSSRDVKDRTDAAHAQASALARPAPDPPSPRIATGSTPAASAGKDAPATRAGVAPAPVDKGDPATPSLAAPPPAPRENVVTSRRTWLRRGAIASAIMASGFAALGVQQGLAARRAYADADAMVDGDVLVEGSSGLDDVHRYRALKDDGDSARRNAYLSAGAAVVFAATAGVLGWRSVRPAAEPTIAFRF